MLQKQRNNKKSSDKFTECFLFLQHGLDREEDGSLKSKYPPKGSNDAEFDHEAILGSRDEAEEFDDLSPEEAKRRLKVLLGKMDLNLNEHIDK